MAKKVLQVAKTHSNPCVVPNVTRGEATIRVYHALAPNCWWSWGYLGALARIRLVYGNQVELRLGLHPVYTDQRTWLAHNGLDPAGWGKWAQESARKMGVPIFTQYANVKWATDSTPAVLASAAAFRQGGPLGERFVRALLRRSVVEGRDAAAPKEIDAAAAEAKLDEARFRRDVKDVAGLRRELSAMTESWPSDVAAGFYNLVVEDAAGRKIVLNHAFEPAAVESAIDFLAGGRLVKAQPDDPVEFLAATGPAPVAELARAFAVSQDEMARTLERLQAEGRVRSTTLAAAEHWEAA